MEERNKLKEALEITNNEIENAKKRQVAFSEKKNNLVENHETQIKNLNEKLKLQEIDAKKIIESNKADYKTQLELLRNTSRI